MTEGTLYSLLDDCYAAFDKNPPSMQSSRFASIMRRTDFIPDEVSADIRQEIEGMQDMPKNIGLAILNAWDHWLKAHPERRAQERAYCGNCVSGYRVFVTKEQPFGAYVKCTCNGGNTEWIENARSRGRELTRREVAAGIARQAGWLAFRPDAEDGAFRHFGPAQAIGVDTRPEAARNRQPEEVWEQL